VDAEMAPLDHGATGGPDPGRRSRKLDRTGNVGRPVIDPGKENLDP
jgi:hypothetical protein